jgi:hypothetical protein
MDHYSKARQGELLRTVDPSQNSSFAQVDVLRQKEQGFIRRLIRTLFGRKTQVAAVPTIYGKENQEFKHA